MHKCLKEGWTTLPAFEKENGLTRWQGIKLSNKLDDKFKEKIGATTVIFREEAKKLI